MKVYIVTKGIYSDYRIVSVWTDKEKAEKMAKYYSCDYDEAQVEEYNLDPDMPDDISTVRDFYHVCYNSPIGLLPTWDAYIIPKRGEDAENEMEWWMDKDDYSWFTMDILVDRVKDKDHAIKIAQDKFAELKAMQEGIC